MAKHLKLSPHELQPLVSARSDGFVTDRIVVDGMPVGFMFREDPVDPQDSGWRFFAGDESDEYMDNAKNHGIYPLNTVANYDPAIIPLLEAPVGAAFEREPGSDEFYEIEDWD